jgi:hypothetical protein
MVWGVATAFAVWFNGCMTNARQLCVVDCLSGDHAVVEHSPYVIGSAEACDWRIVDEGMPSELFTVQEWGRQWRLMPASGGRMVFDGMEMGSAGVDVEPGEDHTLVASGQYFALRVTASPEEWAAQVDPQQWFITDSRGGQSTGPFGWLELAQQLRAGSGADDSIVLCKGLGMGFYPHDLVDTVPDHVVLPGHNAPTMIPNPGAGAFHGPSLTPMMASAADPGIDVEYGEFTCPVCWLKFNRGDVMSIATHAALRGDPVLGESAMQRFHATRFNDKGQALDAMGVPSPEQACPHCRRVLSPAFMDMPHHIFSIVGAPSSGKSYYISVLVKMLQATLYQTFGVTFRDADPSSNVILTQMKTQLFSAGSAEEAYLAKTDLEGALYETLPRQGRMVRLPRPFTFKLSERDREREASIVFYDNAGEHFEPTRNSADSPGAQHIAVADGIFFLFDPLHSADFRRLLTEVNDPQLLGQRLDQQDVILAETEVRIKTLLGMESRQRLDTPFAVMIGKCDTWLPLLGPEPLLPALVDGKLSLSNLRKNSDRLREFMLQIAPAIVANADAISSDVMFFALSPLGVSPIEFTDHDGSRKIGPDPRKLNPQFVEVPTLWVLSKLMPALVPSE